MSKNNLKDQMLQMKKVIEVKYDESVWNIEDETESVKPKFTNVCTL